MSEAATLGYAGDVSVQAAWAGLASAPDAVLIDVRTEAEWTYVGVPDLTELGKSPVLVSWNVFPGGDIIPGFAERLTTELAPRGTGSEALLYFICRSGSRSRHAAIAATAAGYQNCFNLGCGFEGNLGPDRHRATAGSWKAEGLPWTQT